MNPSPSHIVAQAVADAAPQYPAGKRADLYDALATLATDAVIREGAEKTAAALREAESAQILFKHILSK